MKKFICAAVVAALFSSGAFAKYLFVEDLSDETNAQNLKEAFEDYGEVKYIHIVEDRERKISRGYGFVEMVDPEAAKKAVRALDCSEFLNRTIYVNIAENIPENIPELNEIKSEKPTRGKNCKDWRAE